MKWLLIALSLAFNVVHAGRSCEERPMDVVALQKGLALAERTQTALKASGADVVLLARAGQDLRKYKLNYSHAGWAYRNEEGQWRVVHKLNYCGSAEAAIYRQGLGEFFLDDPFQYVTAFAVPNANLQQSLRKILMDDVEVLRLHQSAYSMLAYPFAEKYQQSNQWALELLAMAVDPIVTTRAQAQAWLRYKNYQPTTLALGALTRLGGRMTAANIAFDDHPNELRFSDRINTATVDSLFAFLHAAKLAGPVQRLD